MRILLVDDHALFVEGLKGLLQANHFEVVGTARDGLEALEQVRLLRPDVVLMDNYMPRCTGIEATRMIKAEFPQIKVVLLTMSDDDATLFEALKSGVSGFLTKGTALKEFMQLLSGVSQGEAAITPKTATRIMGAFANSAHKAAETSSTRAVQDNMNTRLSRELTPRQIDIVRLIIEGHTYKQIALALFISERTVNYHVAEILAKLRLQNRAQVIAYATSHGLVDVNNMKPLPIIGQQSSR
jgi:two-component system NarL family response regulator